uniref:Mitochondrial pyruvate carrier 2-like n=1 Tax=Rhizophora mucronata TaxID=61149 RepID=A0A2P2JB93_RHIMU
MKRVADYTAPTSAYPISTSCQSNTKLQYSTKSRKGWLHQSRRQQTSVIILLQQQSVPQKNNHAVFCA